MKVSAPLSSSLLMIERELPGYLSTARSLKFATDPSHNIFQRIASVVSQTFQTAKELLAYRPRLTDFAKNIQKLDGDFAKINERIKENNKPICAYFVSCYDSNGAILGDQLYYYHHYKIKGFEEHYAVAPKVVRSTSDMYAFLSQLKNEYPNREIKVVDVVAHGSQSTICIPTNPDSPEEHLDFTKIKANEFSACAKDAVIILDACSTAQDSNNIARTIAKQNPGKTVLAPGRSLYFSKPAIKQSAEGPRVDHVTHGFAILNAYSNKKYQYTTPLAKHIAEGNVLATPRESIPQDIVHLLTNFQISTTQLDSALDSKNIYINKQILETFHKLSPETQTQIKYLVWKNNNSPLDKGNDFGGDFLRENPQDKTVIDAFRTVLAHMEEDFDEDPTIPILRSTIRTSVNIGLFIGNITTFFIRCHKAFSDGIVTPLQNLFQRKVQVISTPTQQVVTH